ncbi:MAG: glycosyltransferase family 39 protein [Candidatus Obscuribacterales bacterium]|nr:glycosyltransferase family 39 protein [Candidatus Obscuribacterales bacterium]
MPWALFALGVMIRVWYCFTHDYLDFGHDAHAHIEHVNYVAQHGYMPPPDGGWEFYQPPAYYWLSALVLNAGSWLGWTQTSCLRLLQWGSCVSTSAVLACVLYVSAIVFPGRRSLRSRSLFVGMVAVIPGMVFLSSQINNDVPAQLIFFLGMCVLLKWWQRPSWLQVIAFAILSGLGILTKTNCVLMLPIALVALFCRLGVTLRVKTGVACLTAAIVLCVSGWFVLPRALEKSNVKDYVVSNYTRIPASMVVKNDVASLLTFDPTQVMRVPYNDSWKDASRRRFAPEYLFKSAFFGEFDFGEREKVCARIILLSSMVLVFAAVCNAIVTVTNSWRTLLPLWSSALILYAALIANRSLYPYAVCGDFRFITPIVLGCGAFMVFEQFAMPSWFKQITRVCSIVFILSCVWFLVSI